MCLVIPAIGGDGTRHADAAAIASGWRLRGGAATCLPFLAHDRCYIPRE